MMKMPKENEINTLEQKCRICGCTWDFSCPGGCYWVEPDLCSSCAQKRSDDIEFLKDLQEELKTQERDCQAAPRFWVIRDYKYDVTEKGYHDRVHVYDTYGADGGYEVEEFAKLILEGGSSCDLSSDELDELRSITAEYSIFFRESNLLDWFEEKTDATIVFEKETSFIQTNTMFLTKQEAKEHLKANSHCYSNKAHTYAMTAWRAPKVARLLKILETFDWDAIDSEWEFILTISK